MGKDGESQSFFVGTSSRQRCGDLIPFEFSIDEWDMGGKSILGKGLKARVKVIQYWDVLMILLLYGQIS